MTTRKYTKKETIAIVLTGIFVFGVSFIITFGFLQHGILPFVKGIGLVLFVVVIPIWVGLHLPSSFNEKI